MPARLPPARPAPVEHAGRPWPQFDQFDRLRPRLTLFSPRFDHLGPFLTALRQLPGHLLTLFDHRLTLWTTVGPVVIATFRPLRADLTPGQTRPVERI